MARETNQSSTGPGLSSRPSALYGSTEMVHLSVANPILGKMTRYQECLRRPNQRIHVASIYFDPIDIQRYLHLYLVDDRQTPTAIILYRSRGVHVVVIYLDKGPRWNPRLDRGRFVLKEADHEEEEAGGDEFIWRRRQEDNRTIRFFSFKKRERNSRVRIT